MASPIVSQSSVSPAHAGMDLTEGAVNEGFPPERERAERLVAETPFRIA